VSDHVISRCEIGWNLHGYGIPLIDSGLYPRSIGILALSINQKPFCIRRVVLVTSITAARRHISHYRSSDVRPMTAVVCPKKRHCATWIRISYLRARLSALTAVEVGIVCALDRVDGTDIPYDTWVGGTRSRCVSHVGCTVNGNLTEITMGSDIRGREKKREDGFHHIES